jgi:hypothetical protein
LILSLSRYGHLNVAYMEAITGTDRAQLMAELIGSGMVYIDPEE